MGNDSNKNTKNLIHLYLLEQKIKYHKEIDKMKSEKIYFIQKNIVDKYKELCHYEEIIDFFEKYNTKIELNENNISDIIEQIPKNTTYKIENINEEYLLYLLKKDNIGQWKYKSLKIENNKRINYIDDFEMIDRDLKEYFKEKNFKVLKGKYIIGNKGIFIYITYENKITKKTESSIFEFGNFDKNGNFNIEYLLDQNEIGNPSYFINTLVDVDIDSIFNLIIKQEKKDIKFSISLLNYPYNFYIFNDINTDNISNYTINNTTLNESSIYKSTISIETNSINIKNQKNDFSLKSNNKLECLIKISIFQKIININKINIQKVFLLNTKYLEQYYFNDIEELIKKKFDNININDLSLNLIDKNLLNDSQFKEINNKISSINNINTPYIYEGEDFNLSNIKKIKIFKSFVIINEDLSKDMEEHFDIRFKYSYLKKKKK